MSRTRRVPNRAPRMVFLNLLGRACVICMTGALMACGPDRAPSEPLRPFDDSLPPIELQGKGDHARADGVPYLVRWNEHGRPARFLRVATLAHHRPIASDPVRRVEQFLRDSARALRLPPDLEGLHLASLRWAGPDLVVTLEQTLAGKPVFGAVVTVVLDSLGQVAAIHNSYVPGLARPAWSPPDLARIRLVAAARVGAANRATMTRGWEVDPRGVARSVWRLEGPEGTALVDGLTGNRLRFSAHVRRLTGHGDIYRENAFVSGDTVSEALLGLGADGTLSGEHVDVLVARGLRVNRRALGYNFDFPPGDRRFGEVMAYYHLDRSIRRLRELDLWTRPGPLVAQVRAEPELNAWYDAWSDEIATGFTPRFDVAGDADILLHELGHATVHGLAPDLLGGDHRTVDDALHEGYADYLACAFHDNPGTGESFYLALLAEGESARYLEEIDHDPERPGRRCDTGRSWPTDRHPDPHITGMIISSILWDLRTALVADLGGLQGDRHANRIAFGALPLLQPGVLDLADLLDAILTADALEDGEQGATIQEAFARHGVVQAPRGALEDRSGLPPYLP